MEPAKAVASEEGKPVTIPQTPHEWLLEIERAAKDAAETKPFALLTGTVLTDSKLFHLAPLVALKFRRIRLASAKRDELIETVLATYVANANGGASSGLPDLKAFGGGQEEIHWRRSR